ncbi:hypothetical protein [Leptodesmis sp.]|uniref:hypothetical protein n=1 Tax=Leptodesmis sp. TaxID=3100501 RepID=UPI0040535677
MPQQKNTQPDDQSFAQSNASQIPAIGVLARFLNQLEDARQNSDCFGLAIAYAVGRRFTLEKQLKICRGYHPTHRPVFSNKVELM